MNQRRQAYLNAMGIELWQRRGLADTAQSEVVVADDNATQPSQAIEETRAKAAPQTQRTPRVTPASVIPNSDNPNLHLQDPDRIATYQWDQLQVAVKQCIACELHQTRKNTVFGVGNQQADWMVVGEAPGADEDRQGEPFVGRAGQLLNNMLQAIGLQREQVYIANILKCRPPNNRDPRPEEVTKCEPFLKRQVELVNPKIILAVGRIAAHNLLKTDTSLARMRGKCFYYGEQETPVVVTYHPAYLLRSPSEKRKAWQDLLFARTLVEKKVEDSC